jgi:hypothetical protein
MTYQPKFNFIFQGQRRKIAELAFPQLADMFSAAPQKSYIFPL